MTHEDVLTVFVIVTALAVVMQAAILFAMFRVMKMTLSVVTRIESSVTDHLNPVLDSVHAVTTSAREPIKTALANLTELTNLVRQRAVSADALAAEVMERARAEIIRVDELLTGIVGRVERVAEVAELGVLAPIREVSAVVAGVRRGLAYFFSRRRQPGQQRASQEEQLFI
jgi:phage-related protein